MQRKFYSKMIITHMKRLGILVLACMVSGAHVYAQEQKNVQDLVLKINRGAYQEVANEVLTITDWKNLDSLHLNLDSALSFSQKGYQNSYAPAIRDSLGSFIINEVFTKGYEVLNQTGNAVQASQYISYAQALSKAFWNETHPLYAQSLNYIGVYCFGLQQYNQAIEYIQESLKIHKASQGEQNFEYAQMLQNLGYIYYILNEFANAEPCYIRSTEIFKNVMGAESKEYLSSVNRLGILYHTMNDYSKALECYLLAAEAQKKVHGEMNSDYAVMLFNVGSIYQNLGNQANAEAYYKKFIAIIGSVQGEESPEYRNALIEVGKRYQDIADYSQADYYYQQALASETDANNLLSIGTQYKDMGAFAQAEKILLDALEGNQQNPAENQQTYGKILYALGALYYSKGDYPQAEQYYLQTLERSKEVYGENHFEYASVLGSLATLYAAMGYPRKSIQYGTKAAEVVKSIAGEYNSSYIDIVEVLAFEYFEIGDMDLSEKCLLKAYELRKAIYGTHHLDYARSLTNLSGLYELKNDYSKAEACTLEALAIQEELLGPQHPQYAWALSSAGSLYCKMGNHQRAESYYQQADAILRANNSENTPSYASLMGKIARMYDDMGDYKKAEQYYLRAVELYKKLYGEHNIRYASIINDLAMLYHHMGDYVSARDYYQLSLDICEENPVENQTKIASTSVNLAQLYMLDGKDEKAESLLRQSLEITRSTMGEKDDSYAAALSTLASIHLYSHRYAEAEKELLEVKQILEAKGKQHVSYSHVIEKIALLYRETQKYTEAEKFLLEALHIRENQPNKEYYEESLFSLAMLYYAWGKYAEAGSYLGQKIQLTKDIFLSSLTFMSERQRELFFRSMRYSISYFCPEYSYKAYESYAPASAVGYNNELFAKGVLLQSSQSIKESILHSGDTALIRQWNDLTEKKQQIMAIEQSNPQVSYLADLRSEAERLEKQITASSIPYRENMHQWTITWDSVQAALKPNQVAIEYMRSPLSKDSTMYSALLLRDTCSNPILIPLFEEQEVKRLVSHKFPVTIDNTYAYHGNGQALMQLIWAKVIPYLRPDEEVFIAPTGILHEIAMESIPYDEKQYLSDRYKVVRLSSTREIVGDRPAFSPATATLYGGIQYDVDTAELYAQSAVYSLFESRAIPQDSVNRGRVAYLKGTKIEVEGIRKMLSDKHIEVHTYTGTAANEESFKALSGTHQNIIHIATHGFYWPDSTAKNQEYFSQRTASMDAHQTISTIDPLDRCGLLFAGANIAMSGHGDELPQGVQDGILTAKEISALDLQDADIVVLSACETARGEIKGDGVFGLQRAFKMAGTQTVLMAIWPVSDEATMLLMTAFYRNLDHGMSKREAFRRAQQAVRTYTSTPGSDGDRAVLSGKEMMKNKGKVGAAQKPERKAEPTYPFTSPYYWAGFILLD